MTTNSAQQDRLALIVGVYVWEGAVLLMIVSLYHMTDPIRSFFHMRDKPNVLSFLSHRDGTLLLISALLFIGTSLLVRWKYRALRAIGRRPLEVIIKTNMVPVIGLVAIAEGALRLFAIDTESGITVGGTRLGPRYWNEAVTRQLAPVGEPYAYDPSLGWTVRQDFSSDDGMYYTSLQGTRSPRPHTELADSPADCRIALVGDSHTFGSELKFEETWAYHLERGLSSGCQLLNFGVPGYSLGQMYLRYRRDVRPWRPDVAILALSSGVAARTLGVYGFNMFPRFIIPWAQPRLRLKDQELMPINVPLPPLDEIVSAGSIMDLPFIDDDWFFIPGEWDLPPWRYLYQSYLFRVFSTRYPARRVESTDDMDLINHELLRSFVRMTALDGTSLIVVYLPDKTDYPEATRKETTSLKILRTSELDYIDLVPCLDGVDPDDRFLPHGAHYAPAGSMAIARCLQPAVVKDLSVLSKRSGVLHGTQRG